MCNINTGMEKALMNRVLFFTISVEISEKVKYWTVTF